ncbi:MAG: hypothetical protein JSW37_08200, partial [Anaerolineales bacterium]
LGAGGAAEVAPICHIQNDPQWGRDNARSHHGPFGRLRHVTTHFPEQPSGSVQETGPALTHRFPLLRVPSECAALSHT